MTTPRELERIAEMHAIECWTCSDGLYVCDHIKRLDSGVWTTEIVHITCVRGLLEWLNY